MRIRIRIRTHQSKCIWRLALHCIYYRTVRHLVAPTRTLMFCTGHCTHCFVHSTAESWKKRMKGEEEEVISELISSDIAPPRLAHLVRQFNQHCRLDSPLDVSIISFDCFDFIATHYLYGPCLIALFSTHVLFSFSFTLVLYLVF